MADVPTDLVPQGRQPSQGELPTRFDNSTGQDPLRNAVGPTFDDQGVSTPIYPQAPIVDKDKVQRDQFRRLMRGFDLEWKPYQDDGTPTPLGTDPAQLGNDLRRAELMGAGPGPASMTPLPAVSPLDAMLVRHFAPLKIDMKSPELRPYQYGLQHYDPGRGDAWDMYKEFIATQTPLGAIDNYFYQKRIAEGVLGEMQYDPTYNALNDPQIAAAGYRNAGWLFYDSGSRTETLLRINLQKQQDELSAKLALATPMVKLAALAGGFTDPTMLIAPQLNLVKLPARAGIGTLMLGRLAAGVQDMVVNAGIQMTAQAVQSNYSAAQESFDGVKEALMIAGGLGLAAGLIRGAARQGPPGAFRKEDVPSSIYFGTPMNAGDWVDGLYQDMSRIGPGQLTSTMPRMMESEADVIRARQAKVGASFDGTTIVDPSVSPFPTPLRHTADFTAFQTGNRLVLAEGTPMPWYHGTQLAFTTFDPQLTGSRFNTGTPEHPMFWFTNHPVEASSYAEGLARTTGETAGAPNVHKVYLRATNPVDITDLFEQAIGEHPDWAKVAPYMQQIRDATAPAEIGRMMDNIRHEVLMDIVPYVKSQGHDAMLIRDTSEAGVAHNHQQVVVFDNKQIRGFDQRWEVPSGEIPKVKLVETAGFKNFHLGNKVVGEGGEAIPVYHGTNQVFELFNNMKRGMTTRLLNRKDETPGDIASIAHWFTSSPSAASDTAEQVTAKLGGTANVKPSYISLKNPLVLDDTTPRPLQAPMGGSARRYTPTTVTDADGKVWTSNWMGYWESPGEQMTRYIQAMTPGGWAADRMAMIAAGLQGYDGVIIHNAKIAGRDGTQTIYGVFNAKDIRSMAQRYEVVGAENLPPLRETADFQQFQSGNKMSEHVADRAAPMGFHGTTVTFNRFENTALGSNTNAPSAKLGHFFASNPETSNDGYAAFWEGPGGSISWKQNTLIQRIFKGAPKYERIEDISVRNEGAQVRPTYLRMENPWVVVDRRPDLLHAQTYPSTHVGEAITDVEGKTWVLTDISGDQGREYQWEEAVYNPATQRYDRPIGGDAVDVIEAVPPNRQINYTQEIEAAIERGHDGVIIKNTVDGGGHPTDIYVVFDPETQIRHFDERYEKEPTTHDETALGPDKTYDLDEKAAEAGDAGPTRSMGAATVAPQPLEGEALKPTGTGLEKLPMTPAGRLLMSASLAARQIVTELADLGGLRQQKNIADVVGAAEKTTAPLEALIPQRWKVPSDQASNTVLLSWLEARGAPLQPGQGLLGAQTRLWFSDLVSGSQQLSYGDFKERVGKAMRRGDKEDVPDQYTPMVEQAASAMRQHWDDYKNEANSPGVDMFRKIATQQAGEVQRQVDMIDNKIMQITHEWDSNTNQMRPRTTPITQGELRALGALQMDRDVMASRLKKIDETVVNGPFQNTADSWFPRMYNQDRLRSDAGHQEFVERVADWMTRQSGTPRPEAEAAAERVWGELTRQNTRGGAEAIEGLYREATIPGSAMQRSLEIPDKLIEDFLLHDVVMANKHQLATFAPSIEMYRRFGDATLSKVFDNIVEDYAGLIKNAATDEEKLAINQRMRRDIADVQILRDRLLNVAGAADDPHSWDQRTIRFLKHYNVWTTLGMSSLTQMGDLFRPALTEGLHAMFGYGMSTMLDASRREILRLADDERRLSGDSLEMVTAQHSMALNNMGDTFNSRSNYEAMASKATGVYFMLNGLNWATDFTKRWGGVITQSNINEAIMQWGQHLLHGSPAPAPNMMERLRSLSIDGNDAIRLYQLLDRHSLTWGEVRLANTQAWTSDPEMVQLYRQMLYRASQRVVITPGIADRPTWMSTPLGSLVSQFHVYGMSSTIRTLYAGLQDDRRQFWQGAAVVVGGAMLLNEIRSDLFGSNKGQQQGFLGKLADGIDRSGVLGIFMDANNAIENFTSNKTGLRPLLGAQKPFPPTPDRMIGSFFGPTAGKATLAAQMLGDVVSGNADTRTWRNLRQFVPGQNLPYLDPVMDAAFPAARPGRKPGSTRTNPAAPQPAATEPPS